MLVQQINHSNDLKMLFDEGYQLEVCGGQLLVHHIPYVNEQKQIKLGVLATSLDISGNQTVKPRTHIIQFSGDHPCDTEGNLIKGIQHGTINNSLPNGIKLNLSFSNKPPSGYLDYYHKIKRYVEIISAPAIALDNTVTPKPFTPVATEEEESVFVYRDTNSSRANIDSINFKLKNQKIAIVGLGGTGAYILDQVAKTCVAEIHIFDGDYLLNHNAFRSPSAVSIKELSSRPKKVDYYYKVYSQIRRKIFTHPYYISDENMFELEGMDYVFLCIDDNDVRRECVEYLKEIGISFIDVGLGVNVSGDKLTGIVRTTVCTKKKSDHIDVRIPATKNAENEYSTNIQISELNALNAVFAVIKWKKLSGFYHDLIDDFHSAYSINDSLLLKDDCYED